MNEERFRHGLQVLSEDVEPSDDALPRLIGRQRGREIRRRIAGGTAGMAVIAALAVVAVQVVPGAPEEPPLGSGSPTPGPGVPGSHHVAYSHEDDIYVKDLNGSTRQITTDGSDSVDRLPQIHDGRVVWVRYNNDGTTSLWSAELGRGGGSAFLDAPGTIHSFGIDAERGIALLVAEDRQRVYTIQAGIGSKIRWSDARAILEFPPYLGRGTNSDDDVRTEWSPDGSVLLVVNTFIDGQSDDTLQIIAANGDPLLRRHGTLARWIDDDTIVYRAFGEDQWLVLDVSTGRDQGEAALSVGGTRPAVSPDGRVLALQMEGSGLPTLALLHLADSGLRLREEVNAAAPVWLDDHTLLASAVEECEEDCVEGWRASGSTLRIDLQTGSVTSVTDVASTLDARVLHTNGGDA